MGVYEMEMGYVDYEILLKRLQKAERRIEELELENNSLKERYNINISPEEMESQYRNYYAIHMV